MTDPRHNDRVTMRTDSPHAVAGRTSPGCRSAESYLEQCIGLDPQTVGSAAIARAVRLRMEACDVSDERTFLAHLAGDHEEHSRFIDEVVVPESWFFRDTQVFDGLREVAIRWAAARDKAPLRVLCAPCAAGEEPYSVAMAFLESGLPEDRFRIDASDVSHAALARAAAGMYSANAFRGDDLAFRDRWFQPRGTTAQLQEIVRKQVHFFQGNLLDESFAADREPYHIVFCRNLLIYLTSDARGRVERIIERLLLPDGLLVLGAAEPPILKGGWVPASGNSPFTLRRGPPARAAVPAVAARRRRPAIGAAPLHANPKPSPQVAMAAGHASLADGQDLRSESRPSSLDDLLSRAHALADAGRHADALMVCQRHQEAAGPSARVFFLMAMLHRAAGDFDRAEACLHKTLYMDPDREDAFLALSGVAEQRGDAVMAERYRQSAARVLARKGMS